MRRLALATLALLSLAGCTPARIATDDEQQGRWARAAANQAQQAASEAERSRDGALEAETSAWGSAADAAVAREALPASLARESSREAAKDASSSARRAEGFERSANHQAGVARAAARAATSPWPRTFHVDETRAGMDPDGSKALPFLTIGAALKQAKRGDTVVVARATYEGPVNMVPGVTLRGPASGPKPVIVGTVRLATGCRVEDVEITSRAESPRGVVGEDVYDVTLRRVVVRDLIEPARGRGYVVGIDLVGCRQVRIEDCRVRNLRETKWGGVCGIRLIACQVKLIGNRVQQVHEEDWDAARGILLVGCDAELIGNVVSDVSETAWEAAYGIQLLGSRAKVLYNTVVGVRGNAWEGAHGIHFDAHCQALVEGNIVADIEASEGSTGIHSGSDRVVVRFNDVWGVGGGRGARPFAGPWGDANLQVDPMFVSKAFRLDPESPCRGAFRSVFPEGLHLGVWGAPQAEPEFAPESKLLRAALEDRRTLEKKGKVAHSCD